MGTAVSKAGFSGYDSFNRGAGICTQAICTQALFTKRISPKHGYDSFKCGVGKSSIHRRSSPRGFGSTVKLKIVSSLPENDCTSDGSMV